MSDKILFVDDEPSALEGFRRVLHRTFDIHTATSGGEGLVALDRDGPFAVVISDMRMPGMNGADFLARVRQKSPPTARMLLTGHADLQAAIDAVNRGRILHFLTKPCERSVLIAAINSGLDQYRAEIEQKTLAARARTLQGSQVGWDADDGSQWERFESPIGLPGPAEAKSYLEPIIGKDKNSYIVLLRLPVLQTVEQRYGEGAAADYLNAIAGLLQQSLSPGDRLFHWRHDVLLAALCRHISVAAVRMEIERLIAETRGHIVEVQGRPMMIACLITFELLPAAQFAGFSEWLAACEARSTAHARDSVGAL